MIRPLAKLKHTAKIELDNMIYESVKTLKHNSFKRLLDVIKETFFVIL